MQQSGSDGNRMALMVTESRRISFLFTRHREPGFSVLLCAFMFIDLKLGIGELVIGDPEVTH